MEDLRVINNLEEDRLREEDVAKEEEKRQKETDVARRDGRDGAGLATGWAGWVVRLLVVQQGAMFIKLSRHAYGCALLQQRPSCTTNVGIC